LKPESPKVLLVGWDAADWRAIDPLLSQGKMPNLARFLAGGVRGNISTLYPALSPMLWTSIATGKRPYKHGIHGFSEPTPDGRGVRPITNLSRSTKALWNILHQAGKRSNVVGWWPSHPAEPIRGVMVSNHYQQTRGPVDTPWPMAPGTVHPPRLSDALAEFRLHPAELDESHIAPFVPRFGEVDQDQDKRLEQIAKVTAENTSIHGAATALMQLEPWDFMGVYYDGIDHFGHGFMRYHPPRQEWIPERDFELYSGVIEAGYRYHDMMFGALLALAGGETTVILMSDHGFHPDSNRPSRIPVEPAGPALEHRHFGILAMKGPGIRKGERIFGASVLDVCPTILRLFGLPAGGDMDGKVLVTAFRRVPKLETIPSWDDVPGECGQHPPDLQIDAVESAEAMKQMVALGYIEPLPEDSEKAVSQTVRELRANLAGAYLDGGLLAKAADILRGLWEDSPEEHRFGIALAGSLGGLGLTEERRGVLDRLRANMQRFAESAAADLEALRGADGNIASEGMSEAEKYKIRRLIYLAGPDRGALAYLEGLQKALEGRPEEAVAQLERGAAQAPGSAAMHIRLGNALLKTGAWQRAGESFSAALRLDPDQVDSHLGLARVKEAAGDWEGMLAAALDATELIFHNPAGHSSIGRALLELGRYDDAEQAFQLALHQAPHHREAVQGLTELYRDRRPDEFKLNSLGLSRHVAREQAKSRRREQAARAPANPREPWPDPENVVTIVSGLPRSGTSMMMQMLVAGGIVPYTDERRQADEDNLRGYFEHEMATRLASNRQWIPEVRGKAVKIAAPLLPRLPASDRYAIVTMRRDLHEVAASQREMLKRLGRPGAALSGDELIEALRKQMELVERWISRRANARAIDIDYADAVADPAGTAQRVAAFLGRPLDLAAMAAAVEPSLRRQGGGAR
jgi:predicted AlkP superfamily phosphohydrolase/phosphomutase/tetratricopeptide (TPR) repeat protein